ncbi:MAG: hypothetical protein N5P05_002291 [Chroococcopsis gigantea SAG 12.99]|jgi:uncharacterized surface protein with fasciclin (FAS1) repeats|nr:fasciclin domain-containing protein [Chlorogloea purpurea SAG 13.99]MDV3000685.1 hypothetical protein [Chroococcopsis gigantea SAG 12.99]
MSRSIAKALTLALAVTGMVQILPAQADCQAKVTKEAVSTQIVAQKTGTIVDIAAANPEFSTLVEAVKAAGLVETLSGSTELTVFAPTNKAFAALPKGTLEQLLKPENKEKLIKILTYHVIPGEVNSKSLRTGPVKTVEGSTVAVTVNKGKVKVNNANVIGADVDASNGVIHVIDKVILPPNL